METFKVTEEAGLFIIGPNIKFVFHAGMYG
jgi:hypothetical protein